MVEADLYVKVNSSECLFKPAVAEEKTHRRQAEATARREAEARREATEAATVAGREATEAEERWEQSDYLTQHEAARVAADTIHRQGETLHDLPARAVAPKPPPIPRLSMERQMSQQEW